MNIITIRYLFLFLFIKMLNCDELIDITLVTVEHENGSSHSIDLSEFINQGRTNMLSQELNMLPKQDSLMILGLSGTGKSTLVNYLKGVPLICINDKDDDRIWRIELEN